MVIDWSAFSWLVPSSGPLIGQVFYWPVQGAGAPPSSSANDSGGMTIGVMISGMPNAMSIGYGGMG